MPGPKSVWTIDRFMKALVDAWALQRRNDMAGTIPICSTTTGAQPDRIRRLRRQSNAGTALC